MSDDLDQGQQLDLALLELKVSADVMLDALREVILGIADLAKRLSEEGRQEEARELLEVGERGMRLLRPLVREEPDAS
jgi:hypothetical protein